MPETTVSENTASENTTTERAVPGRSAPAAGPARRPRYSTSTILTAVALGAAVGVVIIPLNIVTAMIGATLPVLAVSTYGIWGMSSLLPLALLRRPGVGVIGGAAAGVVSSLSPYGLQMVVMMLAWGVLMELPFAVLRYRRWSQATFLVVGGVMGVVTTGMSIVQMNLTTLAAPMLAAVCVVQVTSFVLCSWGSYRVAGAVARAGVVGGRRA